MLLLPDGAGCGDRGTPVKRSGNTVVPPMSPRENELGICGGHITGPCQIELVSTVGGRWFDPSTMTSLMPLWLAVLMAEGEERSMAWSCISLFKVNWCSKPGSQSKFPSSRCWPPVMSGSP